MASAISLPAFGSSLSQRQDRTFTHTPSDPATRTLLSFKAPFSDDAFDPASPRKLRSLISYSSYTEPVSLHARSYHFVRRVLVRALTSQVESFNETNSETAFKADRPEDLDASSTKETLDIRALAHGLTSQIESFSETNTKTIFKPARPLNSVASSTKEIADVETSVTSNYMKTTIKERNPKLTNSIASQRTALDYSQILKYPIVTESGMRNILHNNTLVFAVDKRADKKIIKDAAKKIFKIQIKKVNTSIMPDGTKKAFLMLTPVHSAVDVAKKIKAI